MSYTLDVCIVTAVHTKKQRDNKRKGVFFVINDGTNFFILHDTSRLIPFFSRCVKYSISVRKFVSSSSSSHVRPSVVVRTSSTREREKSSNLHLSNTSKNFIDYFDSATLFSLEQLQLISLLGVKSSSSLTTPMSKEMLTELENERNILVNFIRMNSSPSPTITNNLHSYGVCDITPKTLILMYNILKSVIPSSIPVDFNLTHILTMKDHRYASEMNSKNNLRTLFHVLTQVPLWLVTFDEAISASSPQYNDSTTQHLLPDFREHMPGFNSTHYPLKFGKHLRFPRFTPGQLKEEILPKLLKANLITQAQMEIYQGAIRLGEETRRVFFGKCSAKIPIDTWERAIIKTKWKREEENSTTLAKESPSVFLKSREILSNSNIFISRDGSVCNLKESPFLESLKNGLKYNKSETPMAPLQRVGGGVAPRDQLLSTSEISHHITYAHQRRASFLNHPTSTVPMEVTQEQMEVLKSVENNTVTVVNGKPGVGKSFIIGELLRKYTDRAAVLAFTGSVVSDLREKVFLALNNNNKNKRAKEEGGKTKTKKQRPTATTNTTFSMQWVSQRVNTIHTMYTHSVGIQRDSVEWVNRRLKVELLIIDECTMLDNKCLAMALHAYSLNMKRLVLIGGIGQIEPIGLGQPFLELNKFEEGQKENNLLKCHTLTREFRFCSSSQVFRSWFLMSPEEAKAHRGAIEKAIRPPGDLRELVSENIMDFISGDMVGLVFTNKTRHELNSIIGESVFLKKFGGGGSKSPLTTSSHHFFLGQKVIVSLRNTQEFICQIQDTGSSSSSSTSKRTMYNGDRYTITQLETVNQRGEFLFREIFIPLLPTGKGEGKEEEDVLLVLKVNSVKQSRESIVLMVLNNNWFAQHQTEVLQRVKLRNRSSHLFLMNNVDQLQPGWALTVNKSQGREFKNVLLYVREENETLSFEKGHGLVAFTRAKENTICVAPSMDVFDNLFEGGGRRERNASLGEDLFVDQLKHDLKQ